MAQSAKERVYAAAEQISAERPPTVSAVREAASVSMADASRYLKQWKQEAAEATAAVIATPGAITDQAAKLAGTIWNQAVQLAAEEHQTARAAWDAEKTELTKEIEDLVAAADQAEADHRRKAEAAATALTAAEERATAAEESAHTAERQATETAAENGRLREELAAAQATITSTQAAMDAIVARLGNTDTNRKNQRPNSDDRHE